MLPFPMSQKELEERQGRELEDSKRKLDKSVPGGVTVSDSGHFQNADGQHVDENGKYVNEPVVAKDVQIRLEDERKAREQAEVERVAQEASRRADADRRAAEQAQAQADSTKADAAEAAKAANKAPSAKG